MRAQLLLRKTLGTGMLRRPEAHWWPRHGHAAAGRWQQQQHRCHLHGDQFVACQRPLSSGSSRPALVDRFGAGRACCVVAAGHRCRVDGFARRVVGRRDGIAAVGHRGDSSDSRGTVVRDATQKKGHSRSQG